MSHKEWLNAKEAIKNDKRLIAVSSINEIEMNRLIDEMNSYKYTKEQNMNKVVIELDEKYRGLASSIRSHADLNGWIISRGKIAFSELHELAVKWELDHYTVLTISNNLVAERIHSADEIKYTEKKHNWMLKSSKTSTSVFAISKYEPIRWSLTGGTYNVPKMTETEFKQVLEDLDVPIPFEFWEEVEV